MTWYVLPWLLMLAMVIFGVVVSMLITWPLYRERMQKKGNKKERSDLYSVLFSTGNETDYY